MTQRPERCETCGSWQRKALDFGHCWSWDRLDGDYAHGPADLTYPQDACEAYWMGEFNADRVAAHGGNPDAPYSGGKPFVWK